MNRHRIFLLALALSFVLIALLACSGYNPLASVTSGAPVAAAKSAGVDITVYNQNVALVKDKRTLALKQGMNEVRFSDVAAQIDPTSVQFTSLTDPTGTRVLEQN